MKKTIRLVTLVALLFVTFSAVSCRNTKKDKQKETVENTVKQAADTVKNTVQQAVDTVKDAIEEVQDSTAM